jgi:hypothetical protein
MASIFTQSIKTKFTDEFINDVANTSSNYYICFGKTDPWDDENVPPIPDNSVTGSYYHVMKSILFGKKVSVSDFAYMAKSITWTSGTVYDYYSDSDPDLYNKKYYVINKYGRVYKCLFNNYGAPSTVLPNLYLSTGDFTTSDGYVWKYLFQVTTKDQAKFSTSDFFPVANDPSVSTHAEPGAIHVMTVSSSANGYLYANGSVVSFISPSTIQIQNNNSIAMSGAYTNSTFYIISGTGTGTFVGIQDYVVNTSGKFVISNTTIAATLDATSKYIISPYVQITGDGFGCEAIAKVNTFTTYIDSIQVIQRGSNYSYATVDIIANDAFITGTTSANAIISPPGGHGSNVRYELGCETTGLSVLVANSDGFPPSISYRQLSLLHNPVASTNNAPYTAPTFSNLTRIALNGTSGVFPQDEIVTGFVSGATGVVSTVTNSSMTLYGVNGTFIPGETITGTYTAYTAVIGNIVPSDLVINTGDIYYYRNFIAATRNPASSEQIKLFFKI